jgi:hypothetical protein
MMDDDDDDDDDGSNGRSITRAERILSTLTSPPTGVSRIKARGG